MAQVKEQSKASGRELNDEEIAKLSDGEFKVLVIKMLTEENQDGGVGGCTAPPHTTRTDRESNGKGVPHQGNKK